MKTAVLLLVAVVVCVKASDHTKIEQKWRDFKETYGKTYRSPIETRRRFTIFQDNIEKIEAHNVRFFNGKETFSMGVNQFSDWTSEEFMEYVNKGILFRPTINAGKTFKSENLTLPDSVDWRQRNAVTKVKDQAACGSCWAFSTTGTIEGQVAIVRGTLIPLSEQMLVDCSTGEGNSGCSGGFMTNAYDYVEKYGIESEADYPYGANDGTCKADLSKIVTKISGYVNLPASDEKALQEAVATEGPIAVAIAASPYLQMYASGILDDPVCDRMGLNHGVLLIGYGSENGQEYYIVKNSWGPSWGEQGYFRLPKNSNNKCGIASAASYPKL